MRQQVKHWSFKSDMRVTFVVLSLEECSECMSVVATSLPSFASIIQDSSIKACMANVCHDVSSLVIQSHCFLPSAHPLPLIESSRFCLRNMR